MRTRQVNVFVDGRESTASRDHYMLLFLDCGGHGQQGLAELVEVAVIVVSVCARVLQNGCGVERDRTHVVEALDVCCERVHRRERQTLEYEYGADIGATVQEIVQKCQIHYFEISFVLNKKTMQKTKQNKKKRPHYLVDSVH